MTNKSFPEALNELIEEHEWSNRILSAKCQEVSGGWGAPMTIQRLRAGLYEPALEAMEIIAQVFNVAPDHFAEYRLAVARAQLDPKEVELRVALRNLEKSGL